jgi:hypothetical protein
MILVVLDLKALLNQVRAMMCDAQECVLVSELPSRRGGRVLGIQSALHAGAMCFGNVVHMSALTYMSRCLLAASEFGVALVAQAVTALSVWGRQQASLWSHCMYCMTVSRSGRGFV